MLSRVVSLLSSSCVVDGAVSILSLALNLGAGYSGTSLFSKSYPEGLSVNLLLFALSLAFTIFLIPIC